MDDTQEELDKILLQIRQKSDIQKLKEKISIVQTIVLLDKLVSGKYKLSGDEYELLGLLMDALVTGKYVEGTALYDYQTTLNIISTYSGSLKYIELLYQLYGYLAELLNNGGYDAVFKEFLKFYPRLSKRNKPFADAVGEIIKELTGNIKKVFTELIDKGKIKSDLANTTFDRIEQANKLLGVNE